MRPLFHPQLVNDPFEDPALYIDCLFERRALLFDLGDIRVLAPRKLMRLSHVFVSHAHMDHFMGFDWLLRIVLARDRDLHLFGPPGFIAQVEHKLAAYTWNLVHNYATPLTLHVTEVEPGKSARCATFRCRNAFRRENETALPPPTCSLPNPSFACAPPSSITARPVLPSPWRKASTSTSGKTGCLSKGSCRDRGWP
jgi:ribonuclease Z